MTIALAEFERRLSVRTTPALGCAGASDHGVTGLGVLDVEMDTLGGSSYRSTFETLVAVMALSSQHSKVARSVHVSMSASSLLGVSCRLASA